jgi:hypothetical protein
METATKDTSTMTSSLEANNAAWIAKFVTVEAAAGYAATDDKFVFVIDLADESVTRYDSDPATKAKIDLLEDALEALAGRITDEVNAQTEKQYDRGV